MNNPLMLNLGCGTLVSPDFVNIDWSPTLRIAKSAVGRMAASLLLDKARQARISSVAGTIEVHNLRKGIPYPDNTVDVVFHSHVLEHIDRDQVAGFFKEIFRALKSGGYHRICVPDLERLAREYLADLDRAVASGADEGHDALVADILEQCVRREAAGTSAQQQPRRAVENIVLGDARKRGETHQWMYDRVNLSVLLRQSGFTAIEVRRYNDSAIPGWQGFKLESKDGATEVNPGSLYVECRKPG